ncbi:MAG: 30S ribosomal protein S20 [Deltaproteobacteria bacterium]
MANHPSAGKRNRQRITRTDRNRSIKTAYRTLVKRVREAVSSGDHKAATTALMAAIPALDTAVSQGVLHRSSASRSISRLTHAVNKVAPAAA